MEQPKNPEFIVKRVIATYYPKEIHGSYPGFDFSSPIVPGLDTIKLEVEFYNSPKLCSTYVILRDDSTSILERELKYAVEKLITYVKAQRERDTKVSSEEVHSD